MFRWYDRIYTFLKTYFLHTHTETIIPVIIARLMRVSPCSEIVPPLWYILSHRIIVEIFEKKIHSTLRKHSVEMCDEYPSKRTSILRWRDCSMYILSMNFLKIGRSGLLETRMYVVWLNCLFFTFFPVHVIWTYV